MNRSAIVYTRAPDAALASRELADEVNTRLEGATPDLLIVFASPRYDQAGLLRALHESLHPKLMAGASSAGEFTSHTQGEGMACALAICSDEMAFAVGVGRRVSEDRARASREMVAEFKGLGMHTFPYRTALVLADALAGHADDLVEELIVATSGKYQFFGGGAGDDAQFKRTQVFYGTEALTDAAVAVEMISKKPIGIGVGHGWTPASRAMRVTAARGSILESVDGIPAADAVEDHARATNQKFDRKDPLPFFLHNVIGIETPDGHRLRVPLAVQDDGSLACAAPIPVGAKVFIMKATSTSAVDAASNATKAALHALGPHKPNVALFFDCVATRLRMGEGFGQELEAVQQSLGPSAGFVGCNSHGQIARAEGQFGGFHNCTAVVCVFPE